VLVIVGLVLRMVVIASVDDSGIIPALSKLPNILTFHFQLLS
jgi:hypothetical protein